MKKKEYLTLDKLEVYKLARKLSKVAWEIYEDLDWKDKKIIGDQYIEATDSVGANIAEGFGRYHYLDKTKFYFNSRASLLESRHWIDLLKERSKIKSDFYKRYIKIYTNLRPGLSGLIDSAFKEKIKNP